MGDGREQYQQGVTINLNLHEPEEDTRKFRLCQRFAALIAAAVASQWLWPSVSRLAHRPATAGSEAFSVPARGAAAPHSAGCRRADSTSPSRSVPMENPSSCAHMHARTPARVCARADSRARQGFKAETEDAEAGPTEAGDGDAEGRGETGRPARLDKKIQAYHGVLAKVLPPPLFGRPRPVAAVANPLACAALPARLAKTDKGGAPPARLSKEGTVPARAGGDSAAGLSEARAS